MCTYNNKLTAAGYFDTSGSVTVNNIAYWDHPIAIQNITENNPENFVLYQNFPNPFNPSTTIKFSISENGKSKMENGLVKLIVYDILGKEVATLVNDNLQPGEYGITFDGSKYVSGIYFYKLFTNDFSEIKKMVLLK